MIAVILPVQGAPKVVDEKMTMYYLQRVVGGYIEAARSRSTALGCTMYVNEEGKLSGLPINITATWFAHALEMISEHDMIVGDAVLLGEADAKGDDTACPDMIVHFITSTYARAYADVTGQSHSLTSDL